MDNKIKTTLCRLGARTATHFTAFAMLLASCQKPSENSTFINKALAPLLTLSQNVTPARSSHVLWQQGSNVLTLNPHPNREDFIADLKAHPMVMVSFDKGSTLAAELAADPRTVLYHQGADGERGFALWAISSHEELNHYAALAHGGRSSLLCGQLLGVNGLNLQLATVPQAALVYSDHLALAQVRNLIAQIDSDQMEATISTLAAHGTRRHDSPEGIALPAVISSLFTTASADRAEFTVAALPLTRFDSPQKNVVVSLPGVSDNETTVIIGAHMDSILSSQFAQDSANPGADDDASGIAILVEALRILSTSQARFARRVEFHAYAAEEVGLWGSTDLASTYRQEGRKVAAMLQLDMVLWASDPDAQTIYLVSNSTSSYLRRSLKNLLNAYLGGDYEELGLSGGTSDHQSWYNNGFPTVFPFENPDNLNAALHTPDDTLATAHNFKLAQRFAGLVLAFLSHHAGLVSAQGEAEELATSNPLAFDLQIALLEASRPSVVGNWDVAIATTADVHRVEVCLLASEGSDFTCQSPLIALMELASNHENRKFFINSEKVAFQLSTSEALGIFGYDSNDHLVSRRLAVANRPNASN